MPIYSLQAPDGNIYDLEAPEGASESQLSATLYSLKPEAANPPKPPEEGILAALKKGTARFGSTAKTAYGVATGDANEAAKAALLRNKEMEKKYADQVGLQKILDTYKKDGFLSAAGETARQIPLAIAEQSPNLAASYASALAGSKTGQALGAPAGVRGRIAGGIAGGVAGIFAPSYVQSLGGNVERQAQEQEIAGKPIDINTKSAATTAIPQTALDVVSDRILLGGKMFGKLIGIPEKVLAKGTSEAIEKLAKERIAATIAKGTVTGIAGEVPTEITQQALERYQAGLPLTGPEAMKEYGETAYQVALLGPLGIAGRLGDKSGARAAIAQKEQAEAAARQPEQPPPPDTSSADYAKNIVAQYQEAEGRKNELIAQLRDIQKNSVTETADRLHNTQIEEQVKAMTPELEQLATEYNKVLPNLPEPAKVEPAVEDVAVEGVEAEQTKKPTMTVGDALDDPVGRFSKEELITRSPKIAQYVDSVRKKQGKPEIDSYSIEDIRNAMPNQLPDAEKADLNSLIAAKTGYVGGMKYTPQDVIKVAQQKNIDTTTTGFKYFLQRATGENEIASMSQPQLHSAFKALAELPKFEEVQILPERTNATIYNPEQYTSAVTALQGLVTKRNEAITQEQANLKEGQQPKLKPVSVDEAQSLIKRTAKLKSDDDIRILFQDANRKGDIDLTSEGNVTLQAKGPQAEFNIEEGAAPAEKTGFNVMRGDKRLYFTENEEEANAKAASLGKSVTPAVAQIEKAIAKENSNIAAGQRTLGAMESNGLFNTPQYQQASARQDSIVANAAQNIKRLNEQRDMLQQPVVVSPTGRVGNKKVFTAKEQGVSQKSFDTREEAERHVLENLPAKRLNELAGQTKAPGFANRLKKEQERRKNPPKPFLAEKPEVKKEPEVKQEPKVNPKAEELKGQLLPMLRKFGLGDVALKIEEGMKDEGSYVASAIKIALDANNPVRVLRHESIHGLKDLGFFTPGQWKVLENQADKVWIDKYLKQRNIDGQPIQKGQQSRFDAYQNLYANDAAAVREEAIADAFADFDVNGAPKGLFATLLDAMRKFFRNLRSAFTGAGYETSDDVFGKVERGELKAVKTAKAEEAKPSLTAKKEEKVDPNDVSRVVTDGPYADAAVRTMNSQITQTSKPLEVDDVGRLFDKAFFNEFKRRGDWKNEKDFKRAINQAVAELKYQLKQTKSGLDWYEQDIAEAFEQTQKYIPSLKKPEKRALFSVIAGIMSPSVNARDNWVIAALAYQHYEKTGILPGNNPATGGLWQGGLESANKKKQLDMLNAMLQPPSNGGLGEKAAVEWLQGDHTVAEITDFRQKYGGMGKSSTGGKATDILPGFTAFGPKVGPFVMNINGIHDVTVDVWMTRTFNRYFGQMMGPDDKMLRAPTEPQRVAIKKLAIDAAAQVGIKPYQVQSTLWFFEQQLFNKLGTGAKSYGFSDGAIKFAESQGGTGAAKGTTANVGANAPANKPTGKQAVGTGAQTNQPTTGQQGINNGTKLSVSSRKFALRPSTGGGEILTGSDVAGRSYVAGEGLGQAAEEHDIRRDREVGKRLYVETPQGDGRGFTGFFSNISLGFKGKPNAKPYEPTLNVEPIADFVREYNNHRGNFDDHIATSIPGFREVQTIVGDAIAKTYKNADMLDIGASEGALIKAITKMSDGKVRTVALDPNFAMAKHFNDGERVEGAVYDTSAFGTKADEGQLAWTEDNELVDRDKQVTENPFAGEEVRWFKPDRKFDVVHEAMVFQFISGNRASQIARAKELMKPDGVLIIEEKFVVGYKLSPEQFRANEAKKDAYKEQYFTKAEIEAKAKAVGVAEKAAFKADQDKKEQAATGMNDLMVSPGAIEDVLSSKFDHVAQFWDSGNFKGYIASDSSEAVERLINNMLPTDSEFANVKTPRTVKSSIASPREGIVLGQLQDGAVEFSGVHYGNVQTDELRGSKYGTGLRGAERRRLENTDDARIKNRVYFYVQKPDGSMPIPESGVGNHVYTQKFKNILGPGKLMSRLFSEARADSNAFESSVVDAGYDGYAVPNMGMMVILNHDVPINYRGTRAEILEKGTKLSLRTNTPEFKKWFGDSKIVDANGKPKVMYHGTSKDVTDFTRKEMRGAPIFLTDDPEFANRFAMDSVDVVTARAEQVLTDAQIAEGRKLAIAAIRKDYRTRPEGKVMIDSIKTNDYSKATPEAKEYLRKAYVKMIPSGPNIMPVYVSAQNPFDYDKRSHLNKVAELLDDEALFMNDVMYGEWEAIESKEVQDAIKAAGFDSFYVKENGRKNIAVYKSSQVKSATGNEGTYDINNPDIRKSLRSAAGMFDQDELNKNAVTRYKSREKVVEMDIDDFLNLSDYTNSETDSNSREKMANARKRVADGTKFTTLPYMSIKGYSGTLKVTGHEGRHRAKALKEVGYKTMPVLLDSNIRWSEQNDPEKFDYQEDWPTRIEAQEGAINPNFSIPFPFTREESGMDYEQPTQARASLRTNVKNDLSNMPNGAAIMATMNRVTPKRQEEGFIERLVGSLAPESFSYLRQKALDRYNRLNDYDKMVAKQMGGIQLLADQSAHWAALNSDLAAGVTASALGVGNRMGGIPVLKNGYTTVSDENGTIKGAVEIFSPLAQRGDPDIYRLYQLWSAAKRGTRLLREGRMELLSPAEVKDALTLSQKYPEFESVQKEWIKFNNGLVKYQIDTGVISEAAGAEFMKYSDYIPFYRQMDGEATVGPSIYQSISGVKAPKKLSGKGEAPLADFLETVVRNTQAAIQAGMKNVAAQRAVKNAEKIGMAQRLNYSATAPNTITILEKGKKVSYESADPLFIDAVSSLNLPELPFLSILSKPADLLRTMVTLDPGFMLANMMRDSVSAYVTSGAKMTPIASTVKNFGNVLMKNSPEYQKLLSAGVIGGYEFSRNIEASAEAFSQDLREKTGTRTGFEKALSPFTGLKGFLEKGTEASDAATRIAVYKATLEETGNEAEAIRRALEVMNFNRKGSSAIVRIAAAAIPFLNARIQGLDVFFRAGIRPFYDKNATEQEKQVQKAMLIRGGTIMALSVMYAAAVAGDPDYEGQEAETKDNNWIIPSLGIKVPIPFEVGTLFKTIPERIYRYYYGTDTTKDLSDSMTRAIKSTFAFNPIPQVVAPLLEVRDNYSAFTQRPIIGEAMKGIAPEYQVNAGTTKMAELLGKEIGMSPIQIDHLYKGYTGTMGMYLADVMDSVYSLGDDNPKASKRFEQTPILKRFLVDPEARGTVSAYYDLKTSVDQVVRTVNRLTKEENPEVGPYLEKNASLYAARGFISDLDKQMQELQSYASMVRNAPMDADEKRDALSRITKAQNELTKNIQDVRKAVQP